MKKRNILLLCAVLLAVFVLWRVEAGERRAALLSSFPTTGDLPADVPGDVRDILAEETRDAAGSRRLYNLLYAPGWRQLVLTLDAVEEEGVIRAVLSGTADGEAYTLQNTYMPPAVDGISKILAWDVDPVRAGGLTSLELRRYEDYTTDRYAVLRRFSFAADRAELAEE